MPASIAHSVVYSVHYLMLEKIGFCAETCARKGHFLTKLEWENYVMKVKQHLSYPARVDVRAESEWKTIQLQSIHVPNSRVVILNHDHQNDLQEDGLQYAAS